MRSVEAFQLMGDVWEVVFDKTGTLTAGRPRLAAVRASDETSETELLGLAAGVEAASEHPLGRALAEAQRIGRTVVVIVRDRQPLALLEIADLVRSDTATTVADLRARGIVSILITGDNQGTARTVAEAVGIERVFANALATDWAPSSTPLSWAGTAMPRRRRTS